MSPRGKPQRPPARPPQEQRVPLRPVPAGQIVLTPLRDGLGWNVAIGRGRGVKRFNLSRGEAAELARLLLGKLPEVRSETAGEQA